MKNLLYLFLLMLIFACSNKSPEATTALIPTPTGINGLQKPTTNMPIQPTNLIFNPPHGQPGHNCAIAVGAPLKSMPVQENQTTTQNTPTVNTNSPSPVVINNSGQKLNPKHGEPGHRCDIAVGVPLNSKPTQVVSVNNPQPKVQSTILGGKNLNPKHGDPGHRCDIAVGAPLNSKPIQPVKTTVDSTLDKNTLEAKNEVKN